MKTLLLSEVFPPQTGGSGRWLWEVYRRLPHEEIVIAAGQHPQAIAFDQTHDLAIHRLPLAMRSWGVANRAGAVDYWRAMGKVSRIVRDNCIRQIHCGKCLPEGGLAWMLRRRFDLSYACFVHGEELSIASGSRELTWLTRRVLHGANTVTANSQNTLRLLRDDWGVPVQRSHVLHPGVDTHKFSPAKSPTEADRPTGWHGRFVVLTVGRLQKRKGHDMLIRALPAIRSQVPNVLYTIVGDGDEKARLHELAALEGVSDCVQFCGEVNDDELVHFYQQCELFALPNREVNGDFEGFGMVLVEAQACGKPVLAGASGGTAETLLQNETGLLVDCRHPELLAQTIIALAFDSERRKSMGAAARTWAVQSFDWESLVKQARQILFAPDNTKTSCPAIV